MFIVFEGIDGSGKTTLSRKLQNFLLLRGIKAIWTKEPYTAYIREIVINNKLSAWEETLLFITDRSIHVRELIGPKLEKGFTVICDRFYLSTFAYQGFGKGIPLEDIKKIHRTVIDEVKPDITFLLDIEPYKALERIKSRGNFSKFEKLNFLQKVREGFLELAKEETNTFILNGEKNIYQLLGEVLEILSKKIEIFHLKEK